MAARNLRARQANQSIKERERKGDKAMTEIATLGLVGTVLIIAGLAERRLHRSPADISSTPKSNRYNLRAATRLIPHALTMLVMVSHASEITRVVSHISALHIVIALSLFALWAATNPESEQEI